MPLTGQELHFADQIDSLIYRVAELEKQNKILSEVIVNDNASYRELIVDQGKWIQQYKARIAELEKQCRSYESTLRTTEAIMFPATKPTCAEPQCLCNYTAVKVCPLHGEKKSTREQVLLQWPIQQVRDCLAELVMDWVYSNDVAIGRCWATPNGKLKVQYDNWQPDTDTNQCKQVIEAAEKKTGTLIQMTHDVFGWEIDFEDVNASKPIAWVGSHELPDADWLTKVCYAAAIAVIGAKA